MLIFLSRIKGGEPRDRVGALVLSLLGFLEDFERECMTWVCEVRMSISLAERGSLISPLKDCRAAFCWRFLKSFQVENEKM